MAHKTRKMCTAQSVIISHTAWLTHTCIQTHLLPVRAFKDAAATNSQPGFCVAARRPNYNLYSFTDRKQASTPVSAHTPNLVIGSRRERHDSDKSSIWSVCCGAVEKNCTIYVVSRTGSGKGNRFQFANQLQLQFPRTIRKCVHRDSTEAIETSAAVRGGNRCMQ